MARKPKGAGAVMADHAPAEVAADDPRAALFRRLNYFPTPPWAARAGGELIRRLDPGARDCWEPACGEGHMAHALADYFAHVWASDIYDHGSSLQAGRTFDFLTVSGSWLPKVDWIVTNPPFSQAEAFVREGLKRARRGVAVLCRSGWEDSQGRERFFYPTLCDAFPGVAVEGVFFERVPMHLGRWEPQGSSATPYSWFVFLQPECAPAYLTAARAVLGAASLKVPISVGTKARLTRRDDARRFGAKVAAPLFDAPSGSGPSEGGPAEGQAKIGGEL